MTAIKKYTRLEASGFWRESAKSPQIEVLISFGKTSIILSDYKDNPLTHWSLAAIKLISHNKFDAVFSSDLENGESLKIYDTNMIEAFLLFKKKEKKEVKSSKSIFLAGTISLIILLALFVLFLPSKIKNITGSIISKAHEAQLVAPFLIEHIAENGPLCSSPKTDKILQLILDLVQKDISLLSVRVLQSQKMNMLHLPGGSILISDAFLRKANNERSLVELLERELLKGLERKPLKTLINEQNLFNLIKFMLGFQRDLPLKQVNSFLIATSDVPTNKIGQLDDFSWVALQNVCLN